MDLNTFFRIYGCQSVINSMIQPSKVELFCYSGCFMIMNFGNETAIHYLYIYELEQK